MTTSLDAARRRDVALLVLRLALGTVFIYHGYGKLFGAAPSIPAFSGMLASLGFPLPAFFAWVVGLTEFFGGIAVVLGVFVSQAALLLAIIMAVAFLIVKKAALPAGDVDLALFSMAVALALMGGGAFSLLRSKERTS
ncbi:DoxX family protein [Candidatus Uhrbacteria bacterium]|nr:DoxX family protein [Candidatus Uhrbacteria bacterium]